MTMGLSSFAEDNRELITWVTKKLTSNFYGEGAFYGDFNRDGSVDVVSGPFITMGQIFQQACLPAGQSIRSRKLFDNFLTFVHDFNDDDWDDILIIGWPGYKKDHEHVWYENPKHKSELWARHAVFEEIDNESPAFGDLLGDHSPELIFISKRSSPVGPLLT